MPGFHKTRIATASICAVVVAVTAISFQVRAEESEVIQLSGTGQQATERFSLDSGLAVFEMSHAGQSNFAVKLLDDEGSLVELLVNTIGSFDGSKAIGVRSGGEYVLDVTASGQWSIELDQPAISEAPSIPLELSGHGQQASDTFAAGSGLTTFTMTHDGSSNFAVRLLDSNGQLVDLLANDIGPFDGSKATRIRRDGFYLLDITADGNWTISIDGEEFDASEAPAEQSGDRDGTSESDECFIATAAYGSPNAPEIDVLRDFRDEVLLENGAGQVFVNTYYRHSPAAAEYISDRPLAQTITREMLVRPLVNVLGFTGPGR